MTIINQEKIELLAQDIGEENVPMLLEIFVRELNEYIETLSSCPASERAQQLGEISHALKSSAASFGADKLCSLAVFTDSLVKMGDPVGDLQQIQEFIALLQHTEEEYRALI